MFSFVFFLTQRKSKKLNFKNTNMPQFLS